MCSRTGRKRGENYRGKTVQNRYDRKNLSVFETTAVGNILIFIEVANTSELHI